MKKHLTILFLLLISIFIFAENDAVSLEDAAFNEFYSQIADEPAVLTRSLSSDSGSSGISVKDYIICLAWEAYYTGDTTELESYLQEKGYYEHYQYILDKYDTSQVTTRSFSSSGGGGGNGNKFYDLMNKNWLNGDIFVCYTDDFIAKLIPGRWKHSGMMDKDRKNTGSDYFILSASNKTDESGSAMGYVGYESIDKWAGEDEVAVYRVQGRTEATGRAAVAYGKQFRGREFNFKISLDDDNGWYCSKVPYRSWLSQGVQFNTGYLSFPQSVIFQNKYCTPQDIADSEITTRLYDDHNPDVAKIMQIINTILLD